jgi:hypothetical protein
MTYEKPVELIADKASPGWSAEGGEAWHVPVGCEAAAVRERNWDAKLA